jgi:hypothetical protein
MKLAEASVIVSSVGDKDKAMSFANKSRPGIQMGVFNGFLFNGPSRSDGIKATTPFFYKVAEKIVFRSGCKKQALALYRRCYENYVNFRLTSNLGLASAQIDECLFVMCRG